MATVANHNAVLKDPVEIIARRTFAQPDRAQAQERFAQAAEVNTDLYSTSYANDPRSFGGRYVAADLFKKQFAEYRASLVSRYQGDRAPCLRRSGCAALLTNVA